MSTTFGVIIHNGKLCSDNLSEDEIIQIVEDNDENYYAIDVAYQANGGDMWWISELAKFLPQTTRVYPFDNTSQGINTIGDIINEIKEQIMNTNKLIENPVVTIDNEVLTLHNYTTNKGKVVLSKDKASLLLIELYKFIYN